MQHIGCIGEDSFVKVVRLDGRNGRSNIFTAHRSVANHDHFVQCLVVFFEHNHCLIAGPDFFRVETHVGNLQTCPGFHVQRVVTVDVGNGSVARSHFNHAHTYQRFAPGILDGARDFALCECDGTDKQKHDRSDNTLAVASK